jgi:hypothetical protein
MKTFLLTLTAMLLFGLTTAAFAQSNVLQIPLQQRAKEYEMKQSMLLQWSEGNIASTVHGLVVNGAGEAFGISKEQGQSIFDYEKDADIQSIHEEVSRLSNEAPGGAFAENASEETQKKYLDLMMELNNVRRKKANELVNEILTPDQLKKIKELQIATMDTSFFVSPGMFEALDISNNQRKQLEEIKNKLKPDVEKQISKIVEHQLFYLDKINEAIGNKLDGITDSAERMKIISEVNQKFSEKYPGYAQGTMEYLESGKVLSNNLKIEMFDVLTDEQWNRMIDLIDNPPDHVGKYFEHFHKITGANSSQDNGVWVPGPNSWKPGDPIPGGYREQRQTRGNFPRPKEQQQNKGAE